MARGARFRDVILGRPPNLILGAFTAVFNVAVLALSSQGIVVSTELVSAVNVAAGAIIALIAFTPPTLNPGDTYRIATKNGEPDIARTVENRATDGTVTRSTDTP